MSWMKDKAAVNDKQDRFNRQLTAAGIVIFIPFVLFTGVFAGYVIGEYFALSGPAKLLVMGIFFAAAVFEVVRLVRFAWRLTR